MRKNTSLRRVKAKNNKKKEDAEAEKKSNREWLEHMKAQGEEGRRKAIEKLAPKQK